MIYKAPIWPAILCALLAILAVPISIFAQNSPLGYDPDLFYVDGTLVRVSSGRNAARSSANQAGQTLVTQTVEYGSRHYP